MHLFIISIIKLTYNTH